MMKKYIYQILCSLFIGGAMVSCAEDYMETDKGHDTLTLTVNQQEIVLNEKNHTQEALTLSWTTGTNYGSGNRISYTLEIAKAGTDFARAYSVDLGTGTYQWTKKTEELNQFLNTQLGVGYAEKVSLEARITATVAGMEEKEQRATVTLDVTTYQPVTPTLYLIGEAAPNGWSADRATPMERTDNGQFTWTGKLNIQVYNDIGRIPSILQPGCRCRRRTTAYLPHIGRRTGRTVYSQQGSDLYSQGRPARPDNDHDRNGKHRMAL